MSVFKIEEAHREGARLVIGLAGISGSGKTFTALQLAWGMTNYNSKKVGLLCTENRRGRLYAEALKDANGNVHRFLVGDLIAPFSPARYIEAINAFAAAGVEVLVIDSVSHEWNGLGGCEDIANAPGADGKPPKTPRWNKAKGEHKKFMNSMLQSPVHVIACMRSQPKVKMEVQQGKTVYLDQGVLPIQEKSFIFEMTASLTLWASGKQRDVMKCPEELAHIFGRSGEISEGYLTSEHGKMLREWVDGGNKVDEEVKRAYDVLVSSCEGGLEKLQTAWKSTPKHVRDKINPSGGCPSELKSSAVAYDEMAEAAKSSGSSADDLNAELGNG